MYVFQAISTLTKPPGVFISIEKMVWARNSIVHLYVALHRNWGLRPAEGREGVCEGRAVAVKFRLRGCEAAR